MKPIHALVVAAFAGLLTASCDRLPSSSTPDPAQPSAPRRLAGGNLGIVCPRTTMVVGTSMSCYARLGNGMPIQAWFGSDNTAVATVSAHGTVYAVAPGTAKITAGAMDGSYTYNGSILITVVSGQPAVVSSVSVSPATVEPGGAAQLTATAYDASYHVITGRAVTWSIDDPGIATITSSGVVTGQSVGSTTARAVIDGVEGSAVVTVQEYQDPMCGDYFC